MTGIGENTLAQPVKPPLRERRACLAKLVKNRLTLTVIGTRHGEKLFETLMTREERLRAEDMGGYYRVACDSRDLNYDKFVVDGEVETQADESYTSHNTERLDVAGTIAKIKTAEYVQLALEGREHEAVQ